MHLLEQHCAFVKQPNPPLFTQPHVPVLHWPEQHDPALKHCVPSAAQAALQWPPSQWPEQHCPSAVQVWLAGPHPGAPQKPFTQLPEQHWRPEKHPC